MYIGGGKSAQGCSDGATSERRWGRDESTYSFGALAGGGGVLRKLRKFYYHCVILFFNILEFKHLKNG
jgi:hypothetical protein